MLSIRLWRQMAEASNDDPIFRRVSQSAPPAAGPALLWRPPRRLLILALCLALPAALAHSPGLLALAIVAPMLMITLMVATPALLPLYAWAAGWHLCATVISGLYGEKHQHTYALLCATPGGSQGAGWAFALGSLHRCAWFAPLHWGTRLCLRLGMGLLCGLGILALLAAASGQAVGLDQARLLLLPALGLALYWSSLTQTLALSLAIGLLASSFDLSRQDATLAGLFGYLTLSLLPLLAGGLALALLGELAAFVAVAGLRELGLWAVWRGLGWREGRGSKPSLSAIDRLR